jgi:transcriptional regulator with GAF, ATPase, and Fis domain
MESARHRRPLQAQFVPAGRQPRILKRMVKPVEMAVDASVVRVEVRNRRMNVRDEEIAALERAALAAALDESGGNASEAARLLGEVGAERRAIRRNGARDEKRLGY